MVSSLSSRPQFKSAPVDPEAAPRMMMGAASPLWLLFGSAAAAGATWWWWTARWREVVNLEAFSALAPEPVAPAASAAEVVALASPLVEDVIDVASAPLDAAAGMTQAALEETAEVVEEALEAPTALEAVSEFRSVVGAVEAPLAVAEAVVSAGEEIAGAVVDDLTRLVGIGPKLAAALGELGVTRFSQIAAWTPDELASFDQLLSLKGRADRDAWITQAKRFAGEPQI